MTIETADSLAKVWLDSIKQSIDSKYEVIESDFYYVEPLTEAQYIKSDTIRGLVKIMFKDRTVRMGRIIEYRHFYQGFSYKDIEIWRDDEKLDLNDILDFEVIPTYTL